MTTYDRLWKLTPREREVAALVAQGLTNPGIAVRLGVGEQTVRTHVSNILGKLGVTSRHEVRGRLDGNGARHGHHDAD